MRKAIFPFALVTFWLLALVIPQQTAAVATQDASPAQEQEKQASQTDASTTDFEVPGIAIGETLPAINLKKQDGSDVALQEIAGKGPVALVFYRSASW
jgi:hypothetical protein